MPDLNFIDYLKTLKPEDWNKKANSAWTVKDVVAHMVGWEKGDVETIKTCWKTKTAPWWKDVNDFDDFNAKSVKYYKNYTPKQLTKEWTLWQKKVQKEIDRIGKKNLKAYPELFDWLFEGGDERSDLKISHYRLHYNQIKKAVSK